jgi:hypothetical protein
MKETSSMGEGHLCAVPHHSGAPQIAESNVINDIYARDVIRAGNVIYARCVI